MHQPARSPREALLRFVIALAAVALVAVLVRTLAPAVLLPSLPPPPMIALPTGPVPRAPVAFQQQIQSPLGNYVTIGCGFLLALPVNGEIIGVTTAHSLGVRDFAPMRFVPPGANGALASFSTLYAPAGTARTDDDLSRDYLLLAPDGPPDPARVLATDPRGAPQPGERVLLYSGLSTAVFAGTVESVNDYAVWVRLDDSIDPEGLSGSPVISAHTGKVVGVAIAAARRAAGVIAIGVNPIRSVIKAVAEK